jgi:hypothetical protein
MFWRYFHLNETTHFVQNNVVSFTIHIYIKKEACFELHCASSSSIDAQRQGKVFLPLICSVSPPAIPKTLT